MYLRLYDNPDKETWLPLLERGLGDDESVRKSVEAIISDVRARGDEALREYEKRFDGSDLDSFHVTEQEFDRAEALVSDELKKAIGTAYENIRRFHEAQLPHGESVETMPGVMCWRRIVPIRRVGLYVPGGTAPLFSTVLMLAVPAKVAGCESITLATPSRNGVVNPAVLYAARVCGVDDVVKLGGAQAIAALACGSGSIEPVDKIFGPGNRYVTFAKSIVSSFCAIDMLAGPSEVMVVMDSSARADYVASDLLSQAEHGADSQVILIIRASDTQEGRTMHQAVEEALEKEISHLGRKDYMLSSLSHSSAIIVYDNEKLVDIVNSYAPEHLIINTRDCDELCGKVRSAGSIFLGPYSPESAGDYASGTNHTLPTSGWAHSTGGVSTDSYIKKITVQRLSRSGLSALADTIMTMAENEDLMAHSYAVKVRNT